MKSNNLPDKKTQRRMIRTSKNQVTFIDNYKKTKKSNQQEQTSQTMEESKKYEKRMTETKLQQEDQEKQTCAT